MGVRTDLALESEQRVNASGALRGVIRRERRCEKAGLGITEIEITDKEAAEKLGKPIGRYVTLKSTSGKLSDRCGRMTAEAECLARELNRLVRIPQRTLFAGLGNPAITPDSLGPRTTEDVLATRHMKRLALDLDTSMLSEVTVIAPGVMSQTGIEAQAVIRSLCREVQPELVIAVDALACSELEHLGSTVQLCNTGISPGSGVENARAEISEGTLGVPCIAIGVPTVTDFDVIAEASGGEGKSQFSGMIVTPREIDSLIARTSALIAKAVNRALHPTLTEEELEWLK